MLQCKQKTCLMTQEQILLELEAAVSMTADYDSIVAVCVQVAQVCSSLTVSDVMLPPLRARTRLEYHGGVVFSCTSLTVSLIVAED